MMNRSHFLSLAAAALTLSFSALACAAPFAYVPNEGSGTVSVIDTATDEVVADIPAGKKPRGLAISGDWLYVSDQPNNRLQMIDLRKREPGGTIALGESPEGVYVSPDGRWVAAAIEKGNDVAITDTQTNQVAFTIKVQGRNPEHAVFSPDGKKLFVSAEEGDAVDIIDFTTRKQVAQVSVGARPRGIGFLPDGSRAYVATENSNEVYVIDTATNKLVTHIKAGLRANGVAVHPDGSRVYVSNGGEGSVSVIDTADKQDRCHHPGRTAPVEYGADAGRQETVCRQWPLEQRVGHRHRAERESARRECRQAALGRCHQISTARRAGNSSPSNG